jgi:hypothetical protein
MLLVFHVSLNPVRFCDFKDFSDFVLGLDFYESAVCLRNSLFEQMLIPLELLCANVAGLELFEQIQIILAYIQLSQLYVVLHLAWFGRPMLVIHLGSFLRGKHKFSQIPN